MGPLRIDCIWCGKHTFRVDLNTVRDVGILSIQCLKCGKLTSMSSDPGDGLIVVAKVPGKKKESDRPPIREWIDRIQTTLAGWASTLAPRSRSVIWVARARAVTIAESKCHDRWETNHAGY
jgi:hypothetical protein